MTKDRQIPIDSIEWSIRALSDDTQIEDCFFTGDPSEDARICAKIRADSEWNAWAWCTVEVTGEWHGLTARDYLFGCNYESEEDFRAGGYFAEMQHNVACSLSEQAACVVEAWQALTTD